MPASPGFLTVGVSVCFYKIDDQGEIGWPGFDDSDDGCGLLSFGVTMRMRFGVPSVERLGIVLDMAPAADEVSFAIKGMYDVGVERELVETRDEIMPGFYDVFTHYNYVFCASGTCYGVQLWIKADMASPHDI